MSAFASFVRCDAPLGLPRSLFPTDGHRRSQSGVIVARDRAVLHEPARRRPGWNGAAQNRPPHVTSFPSPPFASMRATMAPRRPSFRDDRHEPNSVSRRTGSRSARFEENRPRLRAVAVPHARVAERSSKTTCRRRGLRIARGGLGAVDNLGWLTTAIAHVFVGHASGAKGARERGAGPRGREGVGRRCDARSGA